MDITALEAEAARLVFPRFDEAVALELGLRLVAMAQARGLGVVIDIRSSDRTFFHAALPGSRPLNDLWARRKSATALATHRASLLVGLRNRARGETLATHGLDPLAHADHGGAVPLRVAGAGVVACVTVSGLAAEDDHALVAEAMAAALAGAPLPAGATGV